MVALGSHLLLGDQCEHTCHSPWLQSGFWGLVCGCAWAFYYKLKLVHLQSHTHSATLKCCWLPQQGCCKHICSHQSVAVVVCSSS
jgi:hypothetical protein